MPIKIPDNLPARRILEMEGVPVVRTSDAIRQDIRPLRVGLLNLMPDKISTETQIARLLGSTPLQIDLTLVRISNHVPRNIAASHMANFYRPWSTVCAERFDGFIVTGAPVEHLPFEEVGYWDELCRILDWTQNHVHSCLTICWAAQAALYQAHGIPKLGLPQKAFGLFQHRILAPASPYLRGFSDCFDVPVSRWAASCPHALQANDDLEILATSDVTGPCLVSDKRRRALHMFNHLEYESDTLALEFRRDGGNRLPVGYFPDDDPVRAPLNRWRSHAHLLIGNWINEMYQTTPFNLGDIGCGEAISEEMNGLAE